MTRRAPPLLMWAPIVQGSRSEWIHNECIRHTRRAARAAYREKWNPEFVDKFDTPEHVRYAKVVVSLESAGTCILDGRCVLKP